MRGNRCCIAHIVGKVISNLRTKGKTVAKVFHLWSEEWKEELPGTDRVTTPGVVGAPAH